MAHVTYNFLKFCELNNLLASRSFADLTLVPGGPAGLRGSDLPFEP